MEDIENQAANQPEEQPQCNLGLLGDFSRFMKPSN
jgi:hypothetical protein